MQWCICRMGKSENTPAGDIDKDVVGFAFIGSSLAHGGLPALLICIWHGAGGFGCFTSPLSSSVTRVKAGRGRVPWRLFR